MAQYGFEIVYVRGEDNTVADTLSHVEPSMMNLIVASVFSITADSQLLEEIRAGYTKDEWCTKLQENIVSTPEAKLTDGLLYWKQRLVIP